MFAVSSSPPPEKRDDAAAPLAPPPSPGRELPRTFGRYTLFELIGKGGMAEIYLARAETELGATRLSVVKQILPTFSDDPRFAEMLIHEAKLAVRLNHKHIVQIFDLGREGEHLYIAMEYVEGFDLNQLLKACTEKKVGLPAPFALGIVADVLEGLDYAHRQKGEDGEPLGIVHRDVSPSNVLISFDGEVKLCDFGIAHANDLVKDPDEALKGKAGYMSPEHARGEAIDHRADVFGAGILLWELLMGRRLYRPRMETPVLEQAQNALIPPLEDKGLPDHEKLEAIVRKALARDRDERYPSTSAFLRDLEGYLAAGNMLASRLELGKWIETTFGTELLEQRRASERKLPKSNPPRSSERLRSSAPPPPSSGAIIPVPKPIGPEPPPMIHHGAPLKPPSSTNLVAERSSTLVPVSDGAMRAFRREVEDAAPSPLGKTSALQVTIEPESLAGQALDPHATGRDSSPDADELAPRRRWPVLAIAITLATIFALIALSRALVR